MKKLLAVLVIMVVVSFTLLTGCSDPVYSDLANLLKPKKLKQFKISMVRRRMLKKCLFICRKICFTGKSADKSRHFFVGLSERTHIAVQSALLDDQNALHFGTRLHTKKLKNLPPATFSKRFLPS